VWGWQIVLLWLLLLWLGGVVVTPVLFGGWSPRFSVLLAEVVGENLVVNCAAAWCFAWYPAARAKTRQWTLQVVELRWRG